MADNSNWNQAAKSKGVMENKQGNVKSFKGASKQVNKGNKGGPLLCHKGEKPILNFGENWAPLQNNGFVFIAEASTSGPKVGVKNSKKDSKFKAHSKGPMNFVNNQ
ncbi:hypothetical protein CCACVL1_15076 [Corchorus capsularis]|uniref:Uncharacterized protein n=1 Tax=Corchorus capsularis TaxID=210143 RepID=A0A1R3I407_COCAP|nr:hypothetical protein CCACVL1_15076 [Corchorus capsularis]